MQVAIVKYNAGNIRSVELALKRLGLSPIITDDHDTLLAADRVILPGVGEASTAMAHLKQHGLDKVLLALKQPVLGVCLGLQLLCKHTEEGNTEGLGIFDATVRQFKLPDLKVPHVGWSQVEADTPNALLADIALPAYFYFVHSYYATLGPDTVGVCTYGIPFSAMLQRANYYAAQFHPEKSAEVGAKLIQNFIELMR